MAQIGDARRGTRRAVNRRRAVTVGVLLAGFFISSVREVSVLWAQQNTAIVTGALRVFVRRGPGKEFAPFGTLPQGAKVDVQEMEGEWARIVTPGGQVGYVNSTFLALPGERERESAPAAQEPPPPHPAPPVPAAPAAVAPAPVAPAPVVPAPVAPAPAAPTRAVAPPATPPAVSAPAAPARSESAAELRALSERNKALESDLKNLQDELAAWKSRSEATPVPVPTPATAGDRLQSEVTRLTAAVEGLQRRLDTAAPGDPGSAATGVPMDGGPHGVSSTAMLLGASGLVLGWLIGSAYGRSQERGRRSRIRF